MTRSTLPALVASALALALSAGCGPLGDDSRRRRDRDRGDLDDEREVVDGVAPSEGELTGGDGNTDGGDAGGGDPGGGDPGGGDPGGDVDGPPAPTECETAGVDEIGRCASEGQIERCVDGRVEREHCDFRTSCVDDVDGPQCIADWAEILTRKVVMFGCLLGGEAVKLYMNDGFAMLGREGQEDVEGSYTLPAASTGNFNGGTISIPGLTGAVSNSVVEQDLVTRFQIGAVPCLALAYDVGNETDVSFEDCLDYHEPGIYSVRTSMDFLPHGQAAWVYEVRDFLFGGTTFEECVGVWTLEADGHFKMASPSCGSTFGYGVGYTGVIDEGGVRVDQFTDDGFFCSF